MECVLPYKALWIPYERPSTGSYSEVFYAVLTLLSPGFLEPFRPSPPILRTKSNSNETLHSNSASWEGQYIFFANVSIFVVKSFYRPAPFYILPTIVTIDYQYDTLCMDIIMCDVVFIHSLQTKVRIFYKMHAISLEHCYDGVNVSNFYHAHFFPLLFYIRNHIFIFLRLKLLNSSEMA